MKKYRVFLIILAILFLMVACSKLVSLDGGSDQSNHNLKGPAFNFPDKLDNPDVRVIAINDFQKSEFEESAQKLFESKYGGKVTYQIVPGGQVPEKLATTKAAGDAWDVVFWNLGHMPLYAIKELLQPIEGFLDFDDPLIQPLMNTMNQLRYKGHYYGLTRAVSITFLYFNQTMFENNGLKTPLQHYKEGTWNWENFRLSASRLTQDTDRDGLIDQWGFVPNNAMELIIANGGDIIEWNEDGTIENLITDDKVAEAMQLYQDMMYTDKSINTKKPTFFSGKAGMLAGIVDVAMDSLPDFKYEWDIAPFPAGPSGKKDVSPCGTGSYGIPDGARNPRGAAVLIYLRNKTFNKNEEILQQYFKPEQADLIRLWSKDVKLLLYQGIGKFNAKISPMLQDIENGVPPTTAIEKIYPVLQGEIDQLFK